MAIDMLLKGLDNHYEIAIVVCGDRDFLPIIRTVKGRTGKAVYGVMSDTQNIHPDLKLEFDDVLMISPKDRIKYEKMGFKRQ